MEHILTFLFLIASASGATIIVSRGDIFKGFRAWVDRMSIKRKWFIHDISIPKDSTISIISVDNKLNPVDIKADEWDKVKQEISKLPTLKSDKYLNVRVEKEGEDTRIFIESKERHIFKFLLKDIPGKEFNVYENSTRIEWVKFFSDLLECPMCAGVWVGGLWYLLYHYGAMNYWGFRLFCTAMIVSLASYLYFKVYTFLENK